MGFSLPRHLFRVLLVHAEGEPVHLLPLLLPHVGVGGLNLGEADVVEDEPIVAEDRRGVV